MTIVRYHIQRGGLYLGDDRHSDDNDPLWCEWGNPFVCGFSDFDGAEHWQSQFSGSCIRFSANGVLVHEGGDAIAAERERCAKIVEALAEEFAAETLDAPYRIQTTEEARRRHGRILAAMSKIRGSE